MARNRWWLWFGAKKTPSVRREASRRLRPRLEALEDRTAPAAISWTGSAGDGLWQDAANWSPNAVPGSGDAVQIDAPGATVTLPGTATVGSLNFSAGTLVGGNLTVLGAFDWSGGTLQEDTLQAAGGAAISGQTTLDGSTFTNPAGQMATLSGTLSVYAATQFDNIGTLTLGNTALMTRGSGDSSAVLLINCGSITKPAGSGNAGLHLPIESTGSITLDAGALDLGDDLGTGASTFTGPVTGLAGTLIYLTGGSSVSTFNNFSADQVDFYDGTGTYIFQGTYSSNSTTTNGTATFTSTASITQFGSLTVANGTTDLSQASLAPAAADSASLSVGGTLVLPQAITVANLTLDGTFEAGNVTVTGNFNWLYGTFSGSGATVIQATATMDVNNGFYFGGDFWLLDNRTLVNDGSATFQNSNEFGNVGQVFDLGDGATIDNDGSCQAEQQLGGGFGFVAVGTGTGEHFLNDANGTFTQAGPGAASFYIPFNNINATAGAVTVQNGTLEIADGSVSSGAFHVDGAGSLYFSGTLSGAVTGDVGSFIHLGDTEAISATLEPSAIVITSGALYVEQNVFTLDFASGGAGVQFPDISASSVFLDGASLNIDELPPLHAYIGETFAVVNNTGSGGVNGIFAGLPEGATIGLPDGTQMQISYDGGQNRNSIVLAVIAVPTVTPTFTNLTPSQTITYGTASVTLSGQLSANAGQQLVPAGEAVTVTLNGVSHTAPLDGKDDFTTTFDTATLPVGASPYTIRYSFGGDGNFNSAADTSTALTVIPYAFTYAIGSESQTYGTPANLAADLPATISTGVNGETLTIAYSSTGDTATANVGSYNITGTLSSGTGLLSNYTVMLNPGTLTVRAVGATVAGDVYVLNQTASGALTVSGNATLAVVGTLQVDSSSASAVELSGNAKVAAASTRIVGGYRVSGNAGFNKAPVTQAADVADPLAVLSGQTGGTNRGVVNLSSGTFTIDPGAYSSITVSGTAHLILNPGTYSVGSGGVTISGNASITDSAAGVLIYNTGVLTISGNASVNLTASNSGDYAGLAIFQAQTDASAVTVSGNANLNLNGGLLYAANVHCLVTFSGNATVEASLVVNELTISGNTNDDSI